MLEKKYLSPSIKVVNVQHSQIVCVSTLSNAWNESYQEISDLDWF